MFYHMNEYLLRHIDQLKQAIAEKEQELKLNASMLAKQTDMAREAEIKEMEAKRRAKELKEGIRHIVDVTEVYFPNPSQVVKDIIFDLKKLIEGK